MRPWLAVALIGCATPPPSDPTIDTDDDVPDVIDSEVDDTEPADTDPAGSDSGPGDTEVEDSEPGDTDLAGDSEDSEDSEPADTDPPDDSEDSEPPDTDLPDDSEPPDDSDVVDPPGDSDDSDRPGDSDLPVDTDLPDDTEPADTETPDTDLPDDSGPVAAPWSRALSMDGAWDCPAEATFTTTSGTAGASPRVCLTWAEDSLYVAVQHPDVALGGASHFLVAYLGDGQTGTTTGALYNTQQPALPVPFGWHLRWKPDDSYNSLQRWDGGAWVDDAVGFLGGPGLKAESNANQVVEWRVPLAAIGVTHQLAVAVHWLYEGALNESAYAGVPASAFTDGYDPDLAHAFVFDLTAATAPALYAPTP